MARVMMAQWENECISQSVLSMARVMMAHRKINVFHCLHVLPVTLVMITQWEN